MFWQIKLSEYDQQFHGVVYGSKTFVFTRVCFGDKPSPTIADICMKNISIHGKDEFPLGSDMITNSRFVDDLLDSCCDARKLKRKRDEATQLLGQFGFEVKEWLSNNRDLGKVKTNGKILGLPWNADEDLVSIDVKYESQYSMFNKREILSKIAGVWDPLGFLTGVLVTGRIIFQAVVRMKIDWNDKIEDEELEQKWRLWLSELKKCNGHSLPRSILPGDGVTPDMRFQLIGCCDGSSVGHGCVIYMRWFDSDESNVEVKFIAAKGKLNPIRGTTVPRAELSGAFTLSRLMFSVEMAVKNSDIASRLVDKIMFTDSTTVLSWIRSASIKYKPYVKNKVIDIQELHASHVWRDIPSVENTAADLISKGCKYKDLDKIMKGPVRFNLPQKEWPTSDGVKNIEEITSEKVASIVSNVVTCSEMIIDFSRFHTWNKIVRVMAYVFRLILPKPSQKGEGEIITLRENEIRKAEEYLILQAQKHIDPTSTDLQKLAPYRDENNVIRIYGRLKNMVLFDENRKHPILLCKDHPLSQLIVTQAHNDCVHPGHLRVMSEVRNFFGS